MPHRGQRSGFPCVLQCVAVCCSVLQCVVACCSVLQHVAERSRGLDSLYIEGWEYAISHDGMSHVTHENETCHTWK